MAVDAGALLPAVRRHLPAVAVVVAAATGAVAAWDGRLVSPATWVAVVVLCRSLPRLRLSSSADVPAGYPWSTLAAVAGLTAVRTVGVLTIASAVMWLVGVRSSRTRDDRRAMRTEAFLVLVGGAGAFAADVVVGPATDAFSWQLLTRVAVASAVVATGLPLVDRVAGVRNGAPDGVGGWLRAAVAAVALAGVIATIGSVLSARTSLETPTSARAIVALLIVAAAAWTSRQIAHLEIARVEAERTLDRTLRAREVEVRRLSREIHGSATQLLAVAQWRLSRGEVDEVADAIEQARESLRTLQQQMTPGDDMTLTDGLAWLERRRGVAVTVDGVGDMEPDPATRRLVWYLLDVTLPRDGRDGVDGAAVDASLPNGRLSLRVRVPAVSGALCDEETLADVRAAAAALGGTLEHHHGGDGHQVVLQVPLERSSASVRLCDRRAARSVGQVAS